MSRGVVQLSAFIDAMIASYLGAGAVASLSYAQTIYLLPISLFGMSVAAAELPEMSRSTGTQEEIHAKLRTRLIAGKQNDRLLRHPQRGRLPAARPVHRVAALYQTRALRAGRIRFMSGIS